MDSETFDSTILLCGENKFFSRFEKIARQCAYTTLRESEAKKGTFAVIFARSGQAGQEQTARLFDAFADLSAVITRQKQKGKITLTAQKKDGASFEMRAENDGDAFAKIIGFFDECRSRFSAVCQEELKNEIRLRRSGLSKAYRSVDAAATLYSLLNGKMQSVFRVGATMEEEVDRYLLKIAFLYALERYPYFAVTLSQGAFSPHFIPNDNELIVFEETPFCARIDKKQNNGYPFRIFVKGKRIALDVAHYLTDGSGGQIFLNAVIDFYEALRQNELPRNIAGSEEETEDAALRYRRKEKGEKGDGKLLTGVISYTEKLGKIDAPQEREYVFPLPKLLSGARRCGVKLTAYLAAAFLLATAQGDGKKNKPYSIVIPVNARNFFPTESMKNFTFFCRVIVDPSRPADLCAYAKQIESIVSEQLDPKSLLQKITFASVAKSGIVKAIPSFIKRAACKLNIRFDFKKRQTFVISNLGKNEKGRAFRFTGLGGPVPYVINCVSAGGELHLSVVRLTKSDDTLTRFLKILDES